MKTDEEYRLLEQQLATKDALYQEAHDALDKAEKQNVLLREVIATLHKGGVMGFDRDGMRLCAEALAATANLAGLVVCYATPVAHLNPYGGVLQTLSTGLEKSTYTIQLYQAKEQK